jgi:four helix bundle protein
MRPHQRLDLWTRSVDFVVEIYRLTEKFPKEEKFGLTSQLRRAAVSVAANVAEGAGKTSRKDFMRYLSNSQGSTSEIETELLIALRLNYLDEADFKILSKDLDDVGRMITGLSRSLQRRDA